MGVGNTWEAELTGARRRLGVGRCREAIRGAREDSGQA